jgi:hypothetical protein
MNNINVPNGPPGTPQQRQRPPLKDSTPILCPCGHKCFHEGFLLRQWSRILTGEQKDTLVTIPCMICDKCGEPLQEMLPIEIQTPKLV